MPFLTKTYAAVTAVPGFNPLFLVSIPVLFICLFILIIGSIAVGPLLKPVLIAMVLISSVTAYATLSYGTIFDYAMIQNMVETDTSEAFSYANLTTFLFISLLGVMASVLIASAPIKPMSAKKAIFSRSKLLFLSVAITALIAKLFFANYAAVGRNNHELIQYITPFKMLDSSYKFLARNYFLPDQPFRILDNAPHITHAAAEKTLTVLVLGETARAMNFSLNGYNKNTNRFTQRYPLVSFANVSACGTATAVSVPCMFSRLSRKEFSKRDAESQQNLVDLAKLAGVDVLWIDNNNGSCKGVCARVNTIDISPNENSPYCDGEYCFDEALLAPLDEKLSHITQENTLIVLHMMGSHGPTYFRRYPQNKRVFTPDCPRSDIQHCTEEELTNTYDNTIAYTDFVLSEIITRLQKLEQQDTIHASMMYISDHGESLGEKGAFLHGLPYAFAPKEQTHVPWIFWQDALTRQKNQPCFDEQINKPISHDNLFDTLLGVMSIESAAYQAENDLMHACQGNMALTSNKLISHPSLGH